MPNRLIDEASPYLQQHAENPVDWYPWGPQAFAEARESDKPLFVSIGYATCHWCHVMERESFESPEIAALMNEAFVNVKVDREERPDIDGIYMAVCQMLTGHGGWPLNVILTPDQEPIFAGTYIPPSSVHGRIGMRELVPRIQNIWRTQRGRMETSAQEITAVLQKDAANDLRSDPPGASVLNETALLLERQYDPVHHGFGDAPKFPMPHYVGLLLRHWRATGSKKSLDMATSTLGSMARGGIFDHLGFGFHRYSTDREWLVPHFEKMLYDQALLMSAYVDGYQATGSSEHAAVIQMIAEYVGRHLTSPEGGFYSAEDADSEGVEGKFYVWTTDELTQVLGEGDAGYAAAFYNVTEAGNYLDETTRASTGSNILHRLRSDDLEPGGPLNSIRERLLAVRNRRVRPILDDKILTDWNGLMIGALARAGVALHDTAMIETAEKAAGFIKLRLWAAGPGLLHRYRIGAVGIDGNIDDYAFFALGCFELFQATHDAAWLRTCLDLTERTIQDFWDEENDGFFFSPSKAEKLIVRRKELQDGAVPSGLSAAVLNMARLGRLLRRPDLTARAEAAARSVGRSLSRYPTAHTALTAVLGHFEANAGEIVIFGSGSDPLSCEMLNAARSGFNPHRLIVLVDTDKADDPLSELAPHFKDYKSIDGTPTAYVCRDFVCEAPTTVVEDLLNLR